MKDIFEVLDEVYMDYIEVDHEGAFDSSCRCKQISEYTPATYFEPSYPAEYEVDGYEKYIELIAEDAMFEIERLTNMKATPEDMKYLIDNITNYVEDVLSDDDYYNRAVLNY